MQTKIEATGQIGENQEQGKKPIVIREHQRRYLFKNGEEYTDKGRSTGEIQQPNFIAQ